MTKSDLKKISILVIIIILIPSALSWTQVTHEVFADEICHRFSECVNLNCIDEVQNGSYYPIKVLRDYEGTNLYRDGCFNANNEIWCKSNCQDCTQGDMFSDRTAIDRMEGYLGTAAGKAGCEKYFNIAVAGFYYLENHEFWNQVTGEKPECVSAYELAVEREVSHSMGADWTVASCEKEFFGNDFALLVTDFVDMVEDKVGLYAIKIDHPEPEEQETQQTAEEKEPEKNTKCIFGGMKYLDNLCTGSSKIEGMVEEQGIDGFSLLFFILLLVLVYMILFRRRRR